MPLSAGAYLAAAAELAAMAAVLALAGVSLRRWLLRGWRGAPARLAEAIAALALLVVIGELAGLAGLFEEAVLVGATIVVGVLVWWLASFRAAAAPGPAAGPPAPPSAGPATVVAVLACAALAGAWAIPTAASIANGILGVDSLWYHLPQAARFVQTGSVTGLLFTDPYFVNWYYPANTELLHAVGMLVIGRDALSPLLNLGFLALALLAAWSIGRPFGLGPHTVVAASIVLGSEMFLDFQPGEARNDISGLAFFLSSVALLVNGGMAGRPANTVAEGPGPLPAGPVTGGPPGALRHRHFSRPGGIPPPVPPAGGTVAVLLFAGLAAGLALGTKLTLVAPVGALTVGVVAIAGRGKRLVTTGVWVAALFGGGGFWYVRNLAHAGNPLPWIGELGPVSLPAPNQALELRPHFSVAHYATDFEVWVDWFFPGLGDSVGPLWPLVLALVVGIAAFTLWRAEPLLAALGAVALATLLAYVFTPLTASGEEGAPIGFVWNLRYIAPALALGLVLLPLLPPLRGTRAGRLWSLLGLAGIAVVTIAALEVWGRGWEGYALAAAALTAAGFVVAALVRGRGTPGRAPVRAAIAALVVVVAALALGYEEQRRYLEDRYADSLAELRLDRAVAWGQDIRGARIAMAGRGGVFFQYPFYGPDLSNRVQWVGRPGSHGAWLPIEDCPRWRAALNEGGYDYVVTTYDGRFPGTARTSRAREWIRTDPAVEQIVRERPTAVFRLRGRLDPNDCS